MWLQIDSSDLFEKNKIRLKKNQDETRRIYLYHKATKENWDAYRQKVDQLLIGTKGKKKKHEEDTDDSQNATIGKITNLMAVDTNRISEFMTWWSNIIGCPIELCVGFYLLYQLLGISCIYGLLVIILTFPVNYQTAKSYNKTQDKLMKARDRRVDLMNEVRVKMKKVIL